MVKNLPAMQETYVWPLGQEDPLEKGMVGPVDLKGKRREMDGDKVPGIWENSLIMNP